MFLLQGKRSETKRFKDMSGREHLIKQGQTSQLLVKHCIHLGRRECKIWKAIEASK